MIFMIKCSRCKQMVESTTCMTDWYRTRSETLSICDICKYEIANHIRNDPSIQFAIARLTSAEQNVKNQSD